MAEVQSLRFRLRGGIAAEWTLINPTLLDREPGVETDTGALKIGDGIRAWNDLPYTARRVSDILAEAQATTDAKLTPVLERVSALESVPPGVYDDTALRAEITAADAAVLTEAKAYADVNGGGAMPYSLTVGTVTTGTAFVSITGSPPNQVLNMQVPLGPEGPAGKDGAPGERGLPGLDGAPGERGLPGADGAPGRDGVDGQKGDQGLPGRGVTSITDPLATGTATILFSDATSAPLPLPQGLKGDPGGIGPEGPEGPPGERGLPGQDGADGAAGAPGRGITSVTDTNLDGTAVVLFSDGATSNLPLPKGPKGDPGNPGNPGAPGRGITSVTDADANGTATIEFTDGTTSQLPLPPGPRGLPGEQGKEGIQGIPGTPGRGITSVTDSNADGVATVLFTDGGTSTLPLPPGPKGEKGEQGTGIAIKGSAPTFGDLPTTGNAMGDARIAQDTGLLHIWDGAQWGTGQQFRGPQGLPGERGPEGLPGADGADGDTGPTGRGIASVTDPDADGTALITYTDATTAALPLPRGLPGEQGGQGLPGADGAAGRGVSSIADPDADGTATVTYTDGATSALPLPEGPRGLPGEEGPQGEPGTNAIITGATAATGEPGTDVLVSTGGTEQARSFAFTIPRGATGADGADGAPGADGADGANAAITDVTATTGAPGSQAGATLGGTPQAATIAFAIPQGLPGQDGQDGAKGEPGQQGIPGTAATIAAGTAVSGTAGSNPSVTNSGTANAAIFDFVIPRGADGAPGADGADGQPGADGADGAAATIAVGTTSTGPAAVVNRGTSSAAILDFTVPEGPQGETGPPGTTTWAGITDKPSEFPPSAHTHLPTEISGAGTIPAAAMPAATTTVQGAISGANNSRITNAVSTATASRVVIRDAAGRAAFADPAALQDAATKNYVDTGLGTKAASGHTHGDATASTAGFMPSGDKTKLDGAVSAGTASRLVIRDASGRAQFANPSALADAATKDYVDTGLGTKATSGHTHSTDQVTGLDTALAGKASTAQAVPAGGTAGQVLAKASATDYATQWIDATSGSEPAAPPVTAASNFTATTELIANPERGWYQYTETHWTDAAGTGHTPLDSTAAINRRTSNENIGGYSVPPRAVVFRYWVMEHMRTVDALPQAFLDAVAADFAAARAAGVKIIARFCYSNDGTTGANSDGPGPYNNDTTVDRTLGHVAQLKSVVSANADVIHALQAGFIGTWGEWYYTDYWGNKGSLTATDWNNRAKLITALLDWGLDFVLLRYVGLKRRYIREAAGTGWAAPANAVDRLGFHNDAFQASPDDSDWGTFNTMADGMTVAEARAYLAAETARPVPMVGETAGTSTRSGYTSTAASMAEHHWSALNPNYHADVLASWTATEKDDASRKLGYRLRLTSAILPSSGGPGASVTITLNITNDGWGHVLTARPIQLVFVNGATVVTRSLYKDIRTLGPGSHTITESITLPPADGVYSLHLAMPDPRPTLAGRSEYAIRLANTTTWADGRNALGVNTTVSGGTGGPVISDHGDLTGLSDDDHTQYALADGTRGAFASTAHVHTYESITAKPTEFPPAAHTHGDATGTAAGFMPAADKTKLDGAVSASTASRLVSRDAAGRAQFVDPAALQDAATKNYVDTGLSGKSGTSHTHDYSTITNKPTEFTPAAHTHADATGTVAGFMPSADKTKLDGATAAATASRLVLRDAAGRTQHADPAVAADSATKGYVDTRAVPTGGTTGQVLAKTSNTDLAVGWTTPAAPPASVNTPFAVRYIGSAWEYTTLAAAQAAGLNTAQTVWFIGNPGGSAPDWARTGDIWTQG